MDRLRQDLIVSFRRLRKSPGFTLAAILTLALGIGANTAIFTAVNAVVFRSLPVTRPEELIFINTLIFKQELPVQSFPNYRDFRDRGTNVLSDLASYRVDPINFAPPGGTTTRIWGYLVTGNYFEMLGVNADRGRVLSRDDDRSRGGHPVTVLSYAFWQRRFGGAQDVIGKKVKLNGLEYSVVGVAPRGFTGTELVYTPDLWVPMSMEPLIEPLNNDLDERRDQNYFCIGRLKAGATMPQAEAALNAIANDLAREFPEANQGMKIRLSPPGLFGNYLRGSIRAFAAVLMAVSGLVLLIACVNLASLLLARAADRRKETAVRLALGAARSHLIRQLLTESMVLSILGGVAGILLAFWLTALFGAWRPPIDVPVIPELHMDLRVMIFAGIVSLVTGVLFGLAPAIQSTKAELAPALKNEAVADRLRRFQLRDVLVTAQVALSVVLLVGSVLVVRSLQHALSLHLGFEPTHASVVSFDLQGYDATKTHEFQRRLLERVRAMPGIESAGLIDGLPLSLYMNNNGVFVEGTPIPKAADTPLAAAYRISPGYLRASQTKLIAGRDFQESDKQGSHAVALVNETFARTLVPGGNAVGKRFRNDPREGDWREIIGVIEDGKYRSLGETPLPATFQPMAQSGQTNTNIIARSSLPEERVAPMMRNAVLELDPSIVIYKVGSMTDELGFALFPARIAASVLGAFGLLAIVLAATGVYGIMAYAVSRRTREIGIRMALGAKSSQVLTTVLSHTALLVGIGVVVGVGLALTGARFFAGVIYGVSATDPATYALAIGMMVAVAFAACVFPARKAIQVDPVTALRTE